MAIPPARDEARESERVTSGELDRIQFAVSELLVKIEALEDLPAETAQAVRAELKGLTSEEARQMTRRTFKRYALGTLGSLALADVLPDGWITSLWAVVLDVLSVAPDLIPPGFPT